MDQYEREHPNEPTGDELRSAAHYQGTGYDEINGVLRAVDLTTYPDYVKSDAVQHIDNLDSLISKQLPLGKDMIVYRGVSDGHPQLSTRVVKNPDDLVGAEIQDNGYVSTTKSPKKADDFSSPGGALFRIKVPKGTKVLDYPALADTQESRFSPLIGNPRTSSFMREKELLLPRRSTFKITGYNREEGGRIIWNAELVH